MSEVFLMGGQMWYCQGLKPISGCPPMPEGTTLTVNLSPEAEAQLSHLAARTHRSPDALVTEAIESFLSRESQDVAAIEAALVEMRTATLIPHEEAMDQLDAAITSAVTSHELLLQLRQVGRNHQMLKERYPGRASSLKI